MTASCRGFLYLLCLIGIPAADAAGAVGDGADAGMISKLLVKSRRAAAQVYVDGKQRGAVGEEIDGVKEGNHAIWCRDGYDSVHATFSIAGSGTLFLEADFEKKKLVQISEKAARIPYGNLASERSRQDVPPAPLPRPARKERKLDPETVRRNDHLNIIAVAFEDNDAQEVKVLPRINPRVISRFTEKRKQAGSYYRNRKGVLLCQDGGCEQQWSAAFAYGDDAGGADNFSLTWKQTVFNGMTPAGTAKRVLICCLNGRCRNLEAAADDAPVEVDMERYRIALSRAGLTIRRSDIMREITASGGILGAYSSGLQAL